jgi:uncharacterized protein (DUF433 family)
MVAGLDLRDAAADHAGRVLNMGTRIPVYIMLEKLGVGEASEGILAAYPQLTRDHIAAALKYAKSVF